jgi:hypothetical protein
MLNGTHMWLLALRRDYPEELGDLQPDRGEYLIRQLWSWYRQRAAGLLSTGELFRRLRGLGLADWTSIPAGLARGRNLRYLASAHRHRRELESHLLFRDLHPLEGVQTISTFRTRLAEGGLAAPGSLAGQWTQI